MPCFQKNNLPPDYAFIAGGPSHPTEADCDAGCGKGACCLPPDQCSDGMTFEDCEAAGGVWVGEGSKCSDGDCPQAPPPPVCDAKACCVWLTYTGSLPPCGDDYYLGEDGVPHLECWEFMDPGVDPGYCDEIIDDICNTVWYDELNDMAKVVATMNCPPRPTQKSPCQNPALPSYFYDTNVTDPTGCFGTTRNETPKREPHEGWRRMTPEEIKKMKEGNPLP